MLKKQPRKVSKPRYTFREKYHCMVDLETMGVGSFAPIVSIGAVKFDPRESTVLDEFHVGIDLESSMSYGMRVEAGALGFWMHPDQHAARESLRKLEKFALDDALWGFKEWFGLTTMPVWGNGATFDNVILRNAYGLTKIDCPWTYKDDRCFRTMKELFPAKMAAQRKEHDALSDARWQAYHLQRIYAKHKFVL